MANKKNVEANKKNTEIKNKKSNKLEQKKPTQKKKRRLHSHLKVNIPLFQSLMMILPSLAKHAAAESIDNSSDAADQVTANNVTEKDVTDDHNKADSSAVALQEAQTSDNDVNSTLSASHAAHGSSSHLVPSHHLSTLSHPQVHYIPSVSMPTISSGSNGQPTHSNAPTTPALPVTFMPEVIKGTYGELHVDANGQYTFVLNPNSPQYILLNQHQPGTDHFALHLSNGSSIIVQIPVTGKQDTPSISGDLTGVVTEDHNIDSQGLLHANGKIDVIDPDQNESSVTPEVISGKYGSLTIDADGHWQYQVDNSLSNVQALTAATSLHESFTIHTKDGTPQTIDMTIGGNDDNAVITGVDAGTLTEDLTTQVQGQLSVTDSDLGEDHFQASQVTSNFGTLSITKDGAWTYSLDNNNPVVQRLGQGSTATDIVTVHSADGTAHQVMVTINGTNDHAVITSSTANSPSSFFAIGTSNGSSQVTEDKDLTVSGQLNITDIDSKEAHFSNSDLKGTLGTLHLKDNGDWTYDLDNKNPQVQALGQGSATTDIITIHSADGTPHQIAITVNGTNDKAVISGTSAGVVTEESQLQTSGILTVTDVDTGEAHFATSSTGSTDIAGSFGTLHLTDTGSWTYDLDNTNPTVQALGKGSTATDTITVHSADGTPHQVTITVNGTNDAATVSSATVAIYETDKAVTTSGTLTSIDVDNPDNAFTPDSITGTNGNLTIGANGQWTFTANSAFNQLNVGDKVEETFTVSSVDGTPSTIKVTINGTNDKATVSTATVSVDETDKAITTSGTLTSTDVDNLDNAFTPDSISGTNGDLTIDANGHWVFTANSAFNQLNVGGKFEETFTVSSVDGTPSTIKITINGTNDKAVISGTSAGAVTEESQLQTSGSLTVTDFDAGQAHFSNTDIAGTLGTLHLTNSGTWTYDLDNTSPTVQALGKGTTATDTITVHSADGTPHQITITVNGTNDKAIIGGTNSGAVIEESQLQTSGTLTVTDVDTGEAHFSNTDIAGTLGTLHLTDNGTWTYDLDNMNPQVQALGKGATATDTITVNSADGTPHQITITVNGTNDTAVIGGTSAGAVTEETQLQTSGSLTITDTDTGEAHFSNTDIKGSLGTLHLTDAGQWTYDLDNTNPTVQALGKGAATTDTITVTSADGTTHQVTIAVNGTNDKAVITGTNTGAVTEDQDLTNQLNVHPNYMLTQGKLFISDVDTNEATFPMQSGIVGDHGIGSFTLIPSGIWLFSADSKQAAIQALGVGETLTESTTITSVDGTQKTILVTINGTNDAPVITPVATQTVTEDGSKTITFHATDIDTTDTLTPSVSATHGSASLNAQGEIVFTPDANYNGPASVVLSVTDGHTTTSQTINVDVTPANDAPVINPIVPVSATEDGAVVTGQLTSTDIDTGDTTTFTTTSTQGGFTLNADGSYNLDPTDASFRHLKAGEISTFTIPVTVTDSAGATDTKDLVITVTGTNDTPVISGVDTGALKEDVSANPQSNELTATGKLDIVDIDTGEGSFVSHGFNKTALQGHYGKLEISQDGSWSYSADNSQTAIQSLGEGEQLTDTIKVTSKDGTTHDVVVTINGTNDKAVIGGSNTGAVTEESQLQTSGTLTVTDVDTGEAHFANTDIQGSLGTLHLTDNGAWTYDLDNTNPAVQALGNGATATDTITVHSADGTPHQVTIKVNGTNDNAVVGGVDTASVTEKAAGDNMSPDHAQSGMATLRVSTLNANGHLSVIDPDSGQSGFADNNVGYNYHGTYGDLILNPNGDWDYYADAGSLSHIGGRPTTRGSAIDKLGEGETLTDTITVHTKDGTPHNIVITINGSNDRPYCSSEVQLNAGTEDTRQTITAAQLLQNSIDVDKNDSGLLTVANLHPDHGSILDNQNGTYTFTPEKDYNGKVHFTYDVKDAHGGVTHTGATSSLSAVADKAVISGSDTGTIIEDHNVGHSSLQPVVASGLLSVTDPDAGQDHFQVNLLLGEQAIHDPFGGFLRITPSGAWGYEVANSRLQSLAEGEVEKVVYRVYSADHTTHDITITVTGTNDQPTITATTLAHGTEDTHYQMQASQFGFTDVDSGDTLHAIKITDIPEVSQGKFVLDGQEVSAGQSISTADISKLQFVPAKDFNGDVQFKYTVSDGRTDSVEATNTLHIANTDDASVISGDRQAVVNEGDIGDTVTATGQLSITDVDTGDNPSFIDVASTATTYGHIQMRNGQWTYTLDESKVQHLDPDQPAVQDHYTFKASDGSTQIVDITIQGTNDKPIIESAHAAPVGTSSTLKLQDVDVISNPTGANIDVAPSNAENMARWGTDQVGVGSGVKLVGLYKPGSDHNWITNPATTTTGHSGAGGFSRIDNHDWWHTNGVPDTVNTGSGGATGHGNAWTGGIAVFEDNTGHQTIAIVNRVCTGGGSEVDYLYYHSYQHLQVGNTVYSGTATAGETINVMDGNHQIASVIADTNGHWEISASNLADGKHTIHVENSAGEHSAETILQVSGHTVQNITPAAINAEIKEDAAQTTINGELRTSDVDTGDTASFTVQADHATKYGHFSIDSNGHYHFTIDNNNADVDHLGVHQTLTEVIPVTSTSTDGTSVTTNVTITIQGSLDKPILNATAPDAQQGTTIALNLNVATTDTGGDTEDLLIKISGLPDTATLNHGTHDAVAKMWVLHKSDLNGLELNLHNANFHGDLHFNATATASAGSESQSATQAISLFVNAPPSVTSGVTGSKAEDSGMGAIDLLSGAIDADTGDTLSVGHIEYQIGTASKTSTVPSFLTMSKGGHILIINSNTPEFQHLAAGETETVKITYNITDSHGGTVQQSATLTVTGTNDSPVITGSPTAKTVTEDGASETIDLLSGATDVDGDTLSIAGIETSIDGAAATTGLAAGLTLGADGHTITVDPSNKAFQDIAAGVTRNITVSFNVADGHGGRVAQTAQVEVVGTNDRPTVTLLSQVATTDEDRAITLTTDQILTGIGAKDVDGDSLTLTDLNVSNHGTLVDNKDGTYTITPNQDFHGDLMIVGKVSDGSEVRAFTNPLAVSSVNDATKVVATSASTSEDIDIVLIKSQLLAGATDVDGDTLDINSVTVNGGHGTVTDNHDGTWTLHPEANFKGDISLDYKVNDGHADVNNHMTVAVASVTDAADINLSVAPQKGFQTDSAHHLSIDAILNPDGGGDHTAKDYGDTLTFEMGITLDKSESYHNGDVIAQYGGHISSPGKLDYAQMHYYSDGSKFGNGGVTLTNPHSVTVWISGMDPIETHIDITDGKLHRLTVVVDEGQGIKAPTMSIFDNGKPVDYPDGSNSESMPTHYLGDSGSSEHYLTAPKAGMTLTEDGFVDASTISIPYGGGHANVPKFIVERAGSTELLIGTGRSPISLGDGRYATGYEHGHIVWSHGSNHGGGNVPPITPIVATIEHVTVVKEAVAASQVAQGPLGEQGLDPKHVLIDLGVNGAGIVDHTGLHSTVVPSGSDHSHVINTAGINVTNDPHHLVINADVTPHDKDDALQAVHLHGLPIGSVVTDGTHTHTIDATDQKDGLDILGWARGSLEVKVPSNVSYNAIITVGATTQNPDGTSAHSASSAPVILDPAHAGDIIVSAPPISGVEDKGPYDLTLTAIDPTDAHAAVTFAVSGLPAGATLSAGSYDANTKTWTITPSEANGLQVTLPKDFSGTVTPHITATSSAGHSHSIDLSGSITDTQDVAVISGTDSASITEDIHVQSSGIIETNQNQLNVRDPDAGEALFTPTGTPSGSGSTATGSWVAGDKGIGQFILHADGRWLYKVDNDNTHINSLGDGDTFTETLTVHSKDGTTHQLTSTIHGTNDKPVIDATSAVTAIEGGHTAHKGQITTTDVDTGDSATYTAITPTTGQHVPGFTLNADGSYKFDATDAGYDHLALGKTEQVSVSVTVTDGAGATDQKDLIITITGTNDRPTVVSSLAQHIHSIDEDTTQHFSAKDFGFIDKDHGDQLDHITITALPDAFKGQFEYDGHPITIPLDVLTADISKITFVPAQDYNGGVQFGFTVNDGHTDSFPKIGNFEIIPVDDISTVSGTDTLSMTEGSAANTHADLTVAKGAWLANVDGHFYFPEVVANDPNAGRWYAIVGAGVAGGAAHGMKIETTQWVMNMGDPNYGHNGYMTFTRNTDHATASYNAVDRVEGDLLINDPDTVPATFIDVTDSLGDNGYGNFSMHNGHWSFVGGDKTTALADGEKATETFTFNTSDGVTHQVTVNLTGSDTKAEFKGDISANLKEGDIGDTVSAHGSLNIVDVDTGQNPIIADFHDKSGVNGYGHFSIVNNQWTYEIDQTKVQKLNASESVQDKITVTASDGTTQDIVISIRGTNDAPEVTGAVANTDDSEGHAIDMTLPSNLFTDAEGDSFTLSLAVSQHTEEAVNPDSVNPGWQGKDTALGMPTWLHFDAKTGRIWGTPPHSADGDLDITVTATDAKGATGTYDFHIAVTDVDASGIAHANVNEDDRATGQHSANGQLDAYNNGQHIIWHEQATGQDSTPNMIQGTYGHLQISTGGTWIYYLDHDGARSYSNKDLNALKAGQVEQEHFTIHGLQNGKEVATEQVIIAVTGKNDGATINGTMTSKSVSAITEDATKDTLAGHLNLKDADHGEDQFTPDPHIAGTYGHLELAANGDWVYHLDNNLAATNSLSSAHGGTETFTINSPDNTASHTITINVNGVDDPLTAVTSPAPPPPVQHDEPDFSADTSEDLSVTLDDVGLVVPDSQHQAVNDHPVTGAAAYLDALGITPAAPVADAPEHQLPADMDIVMAEADHIVLGHDDVAHLDLSGALEHQGHEHDTNQQDHDDTQHHQVDDLPGIDPNS
ncbi:VCBS domain-containing protein [Vibrio sp. 10N.222.49.A3]|uniref:VCBS domain-containing protein n=2 Tax=Vibrio TaxID=662 RepID=UPI00354C4F34